MAGDDDFLNDFPDDLEPQLPDVEGMPGSAPAAAEPPPPPPVKRPRGRPRKHPLPNGTTTTTVGGGNTGAPEVKLTIKPQRPAPQVSSPPEQRSTVEQDSTKNDRTSILELMGGSVDGLIRVERTVANGVPSENAKKNYLGWVGEFEDSPGFESMLAARFGGGQYKISGKVKGEVITKVLPLPGDSKPLVEDEDKGLADSIFDTIDDLPPRRGPPGGFYGGPTDSRGYPLPQNYPNAPWALPAGSAASSEEKRLRDELEREREERRRMETIQREERLKREIDQKLAGSAANAGPRVDPFDSYLKMLQAQAEQQATRWEQERRERLDREERERKERQEREDKERAEKREREERLEKERKEEQQRQDKLFQTMLQLNDPQRTLSLVTALKTVANPGPSEGSDPVSTFLKVGKAFEAWQDLRGGGGGDAEKSEIEQKAEAAQKIIQTTGQVIGPVLQGILERLQKPQEPAQPQLSPEEYARRLAAARARMMQQATAGPRPAPNPPTQVPGPTPQQLPAQNNHPQPQPQPQQPAAHTEPSSKDMVYFKLLNWTLDKYEKKNPPEVTAVMIKVYAEGLGATDELKDIAAEDPATMEAKLALFVGLLKGQDKVSIEKLIAMLKTVEGRAWLGTLLDKLKADLAPPPAAPTAGA